MKLFTVGEFLSSPKDQSPDIQYLSTGWSCEAVASTTSFAWELGSSSRRRKKCACISSVYGNSAGVHVWGAHVATASQVIIPWQSGTQSL